MRVNKSWIETHFEMSAAVIWAVKNQIGGTYSKINQAQNAHGRTELYEIAEALTNDFEALHKKTDWEKTDYFNAIDEFVKSFNKKT